MGGICPQNTNYWCPLQGDSCNKIPKSCVLLVAGTGADKILFQLKLQYKVTAEGKMELKELKELSN